MRKYIISFTLMMIVSLGYAQVNKTTQNAAMAAPPDGGCTSCYKWNIDRDNDGFGDPSEFVNSDTKPTGYVANQSDLDDTTPYITNIAPQTFYRDADADTFGSPTVTVYYSVKPTGYVTNNTDCNDADTTLNPNTIWYRDADGDSFGVSTPTLVQCTQPAGYVRNASDYNDTTINITNIAPQTFYRDADGDTFGSTTVTVYYSVKPTGYVTNSTDCNDGDASLNPNTIWYRDADGDGFGISATTLVQCAQPAGYVRNSSDYNDTTVNITNIAPQTFYRDADSDTFGNLSVTVFYSVKPAGYVTNSTDCNDADASLNPNTVWYRDADGDSFGTSATTLVQCAQPAGYVRNSSDYNDTTVNITNIAPQTFYRDADGDTFGNASVSVYYSVKPTGYVTNSTDCNDADASLNPTTVWYRDADADGFGNTTPTLVQCTQPAGYVRNSSDYNDATVNITNIAPQTFYQDADGDTFGNPSVSVYYSVKPTGYVTNNSDYNDTTVNITNIAPQTFYRDADGDTFGNLSITVYYSLKPTGYVTNSTDCNDADVSLNPNTVWYRDADGDGFGNTTPTLVQCTQPAGYVRNSSDYNDATVNITNIAPQTFYQDADGDTFGNPSVSLYYSVKPTGYVTNSTDCNDADVSLNPNTIWYRDADGDGFGVSTPTLVQCIQPAGYVRNSSDYNDTTINITNIAPQTFYRDADGDTFGTSSVSLYYSVKPTGYVTNSTDCNDADASLNPNTVWYRDADGDGFGNTTPTLVQCTQPAGYVRNSSDYNDTTVNITNIAPQTFYQDADGDTYGNLNVNKFYSVKPVGYVTNSLDYNDTTINITNIAPQTFYQDGDGDTFGNASVNVYYSSKPTGYVLSSTDCNDGDPSVNPNTKWYADNEGDGLGDPFNFVQQCVKPEGNYIRDNSDNCPLVLGSSSDCNALAAPSLDQNYIITKTYKKPTSTVFIAPTPDKAQTNITYFDGLGRPMQQIANQQSMSGKDIITHIGYDDFGRQKMDYLPYASSNTNMVYDVNASVNTLTFYNTTKYENTTNPFSEKKLESSPLSRVMKQAAPGVDWTMNAGHEIKLDYQTNSNATEVKLFTANTAWDAGLGLYTPAFLNGAGTTYYEVNQLYKTVTYDENTGATPTEINGSTVEFKNKEGQVVLKRTYDAGTNHDTYYVYDTYANLTYVIPPTAADAAITSTILDDLCYQYKYDYRNRLVEKKLPGKQWEFIVYDKLDRAVATGPVYSPFSNSSVGTVGWLITKYDVFNRPVYTGWEQSTTVTSAGRFSKQTTMNGLTTISENKQATVNTIDSITTYYSNGVVPTTFKLLTINYYDDYNFQAFTPAISYTAPVYYNNTIKPKGLPTGSWVRVLTTLVSTTGESSYTLYDVKARPIRNFTTNFLGGYTQIDNNLDAFSGQLQYTETKHKRLIGDAELYVKDAFSYSAQDRLLSHTHQIGTSGTPQLLASNTYDELGQLIAKKVGNIESSPLQKVDYVYNIRGWLTEINKTSALQQGTDPKDLFAFKINYNKVEGDATVAKALYNGNIAETFWSSGSDGGFVRAYGYKYDNLNRLKDATYQKPGNVNPLPKSYDENLTYDKNGNIKTLLRNGDIDGALPANGIDNLAYTYGTNSNRLLNVLDNSNNTSGFNDVNKIGDDYTYDANGNLITDKNKNITGITYNHLNLPSKITFATTGDIVYIYNAAGQKTQKIVTSTTPVSVVTTDYLAGFQYKDNVLQFFPTTEGYVKNTAGVYSYVFNYADHLGNVRLSYSDTDKNGIIASSEIVEENNYYPFGLKHKGYNDGIPNTYKYKYNGKELQDELGLGLYDYGFRNYDPAIGRWVNIDPLLNDLDFKFDPNDIDKDDDDEVDFAMKTTLGNGGGIFNTDNLNPYSYGYNDPIRFDDPDGRCPICVYVVAALLYSEFANAPSGNAKTDSRNYNDSKSNKALVSGAVLAGGARTIINSAKAKAVEKATETTKGEKTHQTYTKTNKETKETYSGRTSGNKTPRENVAARDAKHHKNKDGFGPAKLDKSSTNKDAIRGREQQLIKQNGGAKSEGGTSGNAINGVSPKNPNAKVYENAAKKEFGQ
ncbi:DUF6443 domain-containing protein [Flavobacterium sp. ZT3R17]|uniref:DUF6443 domain-containing protein n=1 Tax=Flavobacterium cryoconiti TaxID=3398736 RepID=UPI003A84FDF8